jgi:hypothetical protein
MSNVFQIIDGVAVIRGASGSVAIGGGPESAHP